VWFFTETPHSRFSATLAGFALPLLTDTRDVPTTHQQDCGQEKTRKGGEAVFDDKIRK